MNQAIPKTPLLSMTGSELSLLESTRAALLKGFVQINDEAKHMDLLVY